MNSAVETALAALTRALVDANTDADVAASRFKAAVESEGADSMAATRAATTMYTTRKNLGDILAAYTALSAVRTPVAVEIAYRAMIDAQAAYVRAEDEYGDVNTSDGPSDGLAVLHASAAVSAAHRKLAAAQTAYRKALIAHKLV